MKRSFGFALLTVAALWLSGCAGLADYPLGLPSSAGNKFFPAMTAAAAAHGFSASMGQDGALVVRNGEGDVLNYHDRQDGLHVTVWVKTDGLTPEAIQQRKVKVKALSDQLVTEAGNTAQQGKAFQ